MTDRLGYRLKLGIVIPSTNTVVQPETDAMRPHGVTNHIGRIHIPDLPLTNDAEFEQVIDAIGPDLFGAVDRVMTCRPAHLIMAMSIPTFWGGAAGAARLRQRLEERAKVAISLGSSACAEALRRFPRVRTIGLLTPYQPVGDAQVARFFEESGWRVGAVHGLKRPSEVLIGHATEADLREGLQALAAEKVDAIVQAGTDLAVADLADEAERWLGIPVIAINVATYWSALRANGIDDRIRGFGSLLAEH
ncbi:MAG: Asp/Glu racemase [Xanthobacteraceae bacterium]